MKGAVVIALTAPILWQQIPQIRELNNPSIALHGAYSIRNANHSSDHSGSTITVITFNGRTMSLWGLARTKIASCQFDIADNVITLVDKSSGTSSSITVVGQSSSTIEINGEIDGRQIVWQLQRRPFQLLEHKFHWVTELPHRR
ncbi:MAG: hypothetical protein ACI8XZ_005381 [Gammaproteobacteria bacterium]|jgi:hypothetical protein